MKHHKYTEEQKEFLRKQIEVCESYLQLTDAFNLTFSTNLTVSAIQSQCSKILKLKLGKYSTRYCTGGRPRSLPIGTTRTVPSGMTYIKVSGDYIADIESDMGAEQRARATYEHLMDLTDDPDILGPLAFLRQREIIHYQRFKELRDYYLKMKK